MNLSMNIEPSPNAALASDDARWKSSSTSYVINQAKLTNITRTQPENVKFILPTRCKIAIVDNANLILKCQLTDIEVTWDN